MKRYQSILSWVFFFFFFWGGGGAVPEILFWIFSASLFVFNGFCAFRTRFQSLWWRFLLEKIFLGEWETECWRKSVLESQFSLFSSACVSGIYVPTGFGKVILALDFEKIYKKDKCASLVCDVLLGFCHFPMWCLESCAALDCIVPEFCLLSYYIHTFCVSICSHYQVRKCKLRDSGEIPILQHLACVCNVWSV